MWALVPQTQRPSGKPSSWRALHSMLGQVGAATLMDSVPFCLSFDKKNHTAASLVSQKTDVISVSG